MKIIINIQFNLTIMFKVSETLIHSFFTLHQFYSWYSCKTRSSSYSRLCSLDHPINPFLLIHVKRLVFSSTVFSFDFYMPISFIGSLYLLVHFSLYSIYVSGLSVWPEIDLFGILIQTLYFESLLHFVPIPILLFINNNMVFIKKKKRANQEKILW